MSLFGRLRGEDGATLVIVTAATVMLFGFAALAVDVGHGMGERRRAQSGVDASALAAAVESTFLGSDLQDLVDQAVLLLDNNLPAPVGTPDWENDAICPDTDPANRPGFNSVKEINSALGLSVTPNTHCISLSGGADEIRVTVPTRSIDTFFAGVIGIDTIGVNSFAQAGIRIVGLGNPPPFVVLRGVNGGDQTCLRDTSGGALVPPMWDGMGPGVDAELGTDEDPCDPSLYATSAEIRGTLLPFTYTEPNPDAPDVQCQNPSTGEVTWTIANGIDHLLSILTGGGVEIFDGNGCSGPAQIPEPRPNTMQMQFGTTDQILTRGLFEGITYDKDFYEGRLKRGSYYQDVYRFIGETMDNAPLWQFIDHAAIGGIVGNGLAPPECEEVSTVYMGTHPAASDYDYYDMKEAMITCIADWGGNDVPIFTVDIVESSRFAFLPQLRRNNLILDPGDPWVHFISFVPVWMQKLYATGNEAGSPDPFCFVQHPLQTGNAGWYMHEAGQNFDCGGSNLKVDGIGSIIIECGMLDPSICKPDGSPGGTPGGTPAYVIELTR